MYTEYWEGIRAGEPAIFFNGSGSGSWLFFQAAPALFPKQLRLMVFFFERLRLQGAKKNRLRLLTID